MESSQLSHGKIDDGRSPKRVSGDEGLGGKLVSGIAPTHLL